MDLILNRASIPDVIDNLKGRGAIELSISKQEIVSGQKPVFIRSGGIVQRLRAWLSGESTRRTKADQVCARLELALRNMPGQDQLIKNVRTQVMTEGRLTGEFLALNLQALQEGRVLVRTSEKPFLLPGKGQQVRILNAIPTEIASDRCIVGFSTATDLLNEASNGRPGPDTKLLSKLQRWGERVAKLKNANVSAHEFCTPASRAKTIICCPPNDDLTKGARTPHQMFYLIRDTIGNAEGVIVIEPQPDLMEDGKPVCSDEGLTEQIRATLERKSDAQENGMDRVIAFASPDAKLLNRIQTLHAKLIQQQDAGLLDASRFILDSESESESDSELGSNDSKSPSIDGDTGMFPRG